MLEGFRATRSLIVFCNTKTNQHYLLDFDYPCFFGGWGAMWYSGVVEPTAQGPASRRSDSAAPRSTMRLLDSTPTITANKTYLPHINPDVANIGAQFFDAETSLSPSETDQLLSGRVAADSHIPSLETKPDPLTSGIQVSPPASRTKPM